MPLNTSKRDAIASRRARVAKYRIEQALTQAQIAERLGVSEATVNADLHALDRQWQKNAGLDTQTLRARQLAEIAQVKRWAWLQGPQPPTLRIILQAVKLEAQIIGTLKPPSYVFNVAVLTQIFKAIEESGIEPEKVGEAFEAWFKSMAGQRQQQEAELEDGR